MSYKGAGAVKINPKGEAIDRPWGTEEFLVVIPGVLTLKRLIINQGSKGGLQYHRLKNECGVVIRGEMIIRSEDGNGGLVEYRVGPGDHFHFEPGVIHQEEAVTEVELIEASSPHANDRVRVEDLFGLIESGLPTTELTEIKYL